MNCPFGTTCRILYATVLLMAGLAGAAPAALAGEIFAPRFSDIDPVRFIGPSPRAFPIHGIDVSRYQGDINWRMARRRGVTFAFIKATEGGDHFDIKFRRNWRNAKKAGVKRGAYHFYYFCTPASTQARYFISKVPRDADALPPVLDIEWNHHSPSCKKRPDRKGVLKRMRIFMKLLEKHYGTKPIIYTTVDFYRQNLVGAFEDHYFWLRSVTAHPREKYGKRKWLLWQYSGTGRIHGIKGNVDLNVFNGSKAVWRRWVRKVSRQ